MNSLNNEALVQRMYAEELAGVLEQAIVVMEELLLQLHETGEEADDSVEAADVDMFRDVLHWFRGGEHPDWMTAH